jgi:hypothetical protein
MTTQIIINKTPHAVYLLNEDHTILRHFPKSNGMIRVKEIVTNREPIDGIPISATCWGETTEIPDYVVGTYYIVSQLVKNALPKRKDLLVPKGAVRDEKGNIMGCTRLDIGYTNN